MRSRRTRRCAHPDPPHRLLPGALRQCAPGALGDLHRVVTPDHKPARALLSGRVLTCLAGTLPSTLNAPAPHPPHNQPRPALRLQLSTLCAALWFTGANATPVPAAALHPSDAAPNRERCVPAAAGPACVLPRTAEPPPCLCMSQIACYIKPDAQCCGLRCP